MDLGELRKRVAEVLGVSASQNELAFEVFTESVSEILTEGITLKVPRIGFFQIKIANAKSKKPQQILYSTLPEDFTKEARTLYLTIDVYPRIKNPIDFDSQVFSIGVGKPLLPLLSNEQDSETSFAMLRKSIEERVRELISEADQIPNFNIWEDSFPQEADELETKTDLNAQLSRLTQDLDFNSFAEEKIQRELDPNEYILKSLLAQNSFEITDDFSTDPDENVALITNMTVDLPPVFDDELFNVQSEFTSPDISVDDLLTDQSSQTLDLTEISSEPEEEVLLQQSEEKVAEKTEDVMFGTLLEEEMKNYEPIEQLKISDLLDLNESNSNDDEEITIEPPTSTKYLLFDQIDSENGINDSLHSWNIEDEHLQEIVHEELQEYDSDKIADENSKVLDQLLSEPIKKEPIEENKIVVPPFEIKVPELEKTLDETNTDDDFDADDNAKEKIEWSWGDELKEEFGLGTDIDIEIDEKFVDDFEPEIETEEIHVEPREEIVSENVASDDTIDAFAEFASRYTSEIKGEPEFDLRKTRIDLFTRLERTLEKEVTFLKEEYEKPKPVETKEVISFSKLETKETVEPKIDFKDEKVFLDFKTPPPKYEFYEEKEEKLLTRPKRITILLSPEELSFSAHPPKEVMEIVDDEPKIETKKSNFGKVFAIMFLSFSVVTALVVYFVLNGRNNNVQTVLDQKNLQTNQAHVSEQPSKNTIVETAKTDSVNINLDEFSDFPRTATPPVPIKQGTDNSTLNLPFEKPAAQKKEEPVTQSSKAVVKPAEKVSVQKSEFSQKVANDIRVSNMIFSDGKTFNIQHSSWRRKDLAEATVARLRDQGFNAFYIEAFLPEKGGTWYRVRVGTFKTEQEATAFKSKNKF